MDKHKVIGTRAVDGVEPGGTVELEDDALARQLMKGGHLEWPKVPKSKRTPGDPAAAGDGGEKPAPRRRSSKRKAASS